MIKTNKRYSPYDLVLAGMESITTLTGTEKEPFGMVVYTGDLVSHEGQNELSRAYVEYAEESHKTMFLQATHTN